jgi:hypothetical protein
LIRELDAEDRQDASGEAFVESIQIMRASGIPDLSEPAVSANIPPGGIPDMSEPEPDEPYDHDAPRYEDYTRPDGGHDAEAFLRDSRAHKAIPLSHLTVAERRERFAGNRR